MKHCNSRNILLSAGIAAATIALSASIVGELPSSRDQQPSRAVSQASGIPAASSLAFDRSPTRLVGARRASRLNSAFADANDPLPVESAVSDQASASTRPLLQ